MTFKSDPGQLQTNTAIFPYVAASPDVATPPGALHFETHAVTNDDGIATMKVSGTDPGTPRWFNKGTDYGIDGQVYGIRPSFTDPTLASGPVNQWDFVSVLLWSGFSASDPVTWTDVQPIFQQYANLYPVMLRFLNLADPAALEANLPLLKLAFGLPITDPNTMPVTRDLSPAKRAAVLAWLDNPLGGTVAPPAAENGGARTTDIRPLRRGWKGRQGGRRRASSRSPDCARRSVMIRIQRSMVEGLGTNPQLAAVQNALQSAIKLEHATIPLYLYALYSLDPQRNQVIADLIQSVVVEEMLHMTLASNILNAIGGTPVIDHPGFIPTYPGPLPGGVESDLRVELAPFSMEQLDRFIQIEQPEHPIEFKAMLAEPDIITIGQFYQAISTSIAALGPGAFVQPPRNQVGPDLMPEIVVVTDVASAQQAIAVIVEQGEGTTASPLEVVGDEYAHYYRFMEIRKGHLLVPVEGGGPKPEDQYSYSGAPVPFDPAGVYGVPTSPSSAIYPAGSAQAFANDNFNYTYTSLLKALHAMVNGDASPAQFGRAIGLMMSLKSQASAMMSGIPNPKLFVGPSFEYQPVNPQA